MNYITKVKLKSIYYQVYIFNEKKENKHKNTKMWLIIRNIINHENFSYWT